MRARVFVTLKPSVFDPQGRTIVDALRADAVMAQAQPMARGALDGHFLFLQAGMALENSVGRRRNFPALCA